MAEEAREIQRLHRMKVNANKFMDRIEKHPEHEKIPVWSKRLKELTGGIAVAEHEAAAAAVKAELEKPGVEIKVPVKHFAVEESAPAVE